MPPRILVVDSQASMRELIALHLRLAGWRVEQAGDAIAAGYAVLHNPPDLIVCDVELRGMNGLEFVAALRADPTVPRIPVVLLASQENTYDRALQHEKTDYLVKPLTSEVLVAVVRKHLAVRTYSVQDRFFLKNDTVLSHDSFAAASL